MNHLFS
jgi:hypothetical protein